MFGHRDGRWILGCRPVTMMLQMVAFLLREFDPSTKRATNVNSRREGGGSWCRERVAIARRDPWLRRHGGVGSIQSSIHSQAGDSHFRNEAGEEGRAVDAGSVQTLRHLRSCQPSFRGRERLLRGGRV